MAYFCYIYVMIDHDTEYYSLKKLCNGELYQFTEPVGSSQEQWHKLTPQSQVPCPHWVFSEEYALTHKEFRLNWHTPYVIDGGISASVAIDFDGTLKVKTIKDGIVEMGVLAREELKLERYRNRMISIKIDARSSYEIRSADDGSGKIHISYFDDPEYVLWNVQYFDYIANDEVFRVVRARSKNEAKVIAWHESCYDNHNIDPETFKCWKYDGPHIIARDTKLTDEVMKTQLLLCEEYDIKEEEQDGTQRYTIQGRPIQGRPIQG